MQIYFPATHFISDVSNQALVTGKLGMIFRAPKTGTINQIGVQVLGISSPQNLRVSLQTTTSAGLPSGSYYGSSAPQAFSPSANTCTIVTLSPPATATMGDEVALVIEWDSTSGSLDLANTDPDPYGNWIGYPGPVAFSSSWGFTGGFPLAVFVGYADGTYPDIFTFPAQTFNYQSFAVNLGGTPDEYGVQLTMPCHCKVEGAYVMAKESVISPTDTVKLYDVDAATVLASASMVFGGSSSGFRTIEFPASVTLNQGSTYTLSLKSNTSSYSSQLAYCTFQRSEAAAAVNGGPVPGAYRQNSGAWTVQPLTRYFIGLVISEVLSWTTLGAAYPF